MIFYHVWWFFIDSEPHPETIELTGVIPKRLHIPYCGSAGSGWLSPRVKQKIAPLYPKCCRGRPGLFIISKYLYEGRLSCLTLGNSCNRLHWCLSNLERCRKTCQNSRFWTILTIPPTFSSQNSSMGNSIPQDQTGLFSPMLVLNIARHIPTSATTFGV